MGIKWTPWQVSMQRRIEVLSAFTFVSIIIFSELATVILLALFLVSASCQQSWSRFNLSPLNSALWRSASKCTLRCLLGFLLFRPKRRRLSYQRSRVSRKQKAFLLSSFQTGFLHRFEFLRGWRMWRHCSSYFPSQLIKTVDLPANKNYIFAVFPHGVIR